MSDMKITLPSGVEVSFADHLDSKGITKKGVKSQIQETLDKNIDKGKKAKPMQKAMPEPLDKKARVGVEKPTPKKSSAQRLKEFLDSKQDDK